MTIKAIRSWLILILITGVSNAIFLFNMRATLIRENRLNYSTLHWILEGFIFALLVVVLLVLAFSHFSPEKMKQLSGKLDQSFQSQPANLFLVQFLLVIGLLFILELILLSFFTFPLPLRSVFFWGWFTLFITWLFLRMIYRSLYKARPTFWERLGSCWRSNSITQKRVFIIVGVLGSLYFLAFIPLNGKPVPLGYGSYFGHADEVVIYPSVIKTMMPGEDFVRTLKNILVDYNWWYGYPYLPISAAMLIVPRLIYGQAYGEHLQINLLLLRQFINVLPMILAVGLLVYLVTQFKRLIQSIAIFIFLLLVPGVIKFNYRFWHPDSIILLLIALTIFFLKRDSLKLRRNFYLAAITCGLAAALKLWGFFFFLTIAGYLLASLIAKISSLKRITLAGFGFIAVMGGTILISSPSLLYPSAASFLVADWKKQLNTNASGYDEPDPEGVYQTGLPNWLRYFMIHFGMEAWFFFYAFGVIILGSLMGSELMMNRLLLSWCLVVGVYLIQFVAVKSPQYMIPLVMPLYAGGFLLPEIAHGWKKPAWLPKINQPIVKGFLWMVVAAVYLAQFWTNIRIDLALPFITP